MTPTPQLLTAEEPPYPPRPVPQPLTDAEIEAFKLFANRVEFQRHGNMDGSVSCKSIDPERLWLTISSLEAKIAELRGIPPGTAYVGGEPVLTVSHAGQVRDKTEDWERKRSLQEDTAHPAVHATRQPGGTGVGFTSLPPVSPPDTMDERAALKDALRATPLHLADGSQSTLSEDEIENILEIFWRHGHWTPNPDAAQECEHVWVPGSLSMDVVKCARCGLEERTPRKPVSPAPSGEASRLAIHKAVNDAIGLSDRGYCQWIRIKNYDEQFMKQYPVNGDFRDKIVDALLPLLTSDRAATEARVREKCAGYHDDQAQKYRLLAEHRDINGRTDSLNRGSLLGQAEMHDHFAAAIRAGGKA